MYRACSAKWLCLLFSAVALVGTNLAVGKDAAKPVSKKVLVHALKEGNEKLRAEALKHLETQGDDKITSEVLIKILDPEVKRGSLRDSTLRMVRMLGSLDTQEAFDALKDYLEASNYRIASVAAESLGTKGTEAAFDALGEAVKSKQFRSVFGFRRSVVMAMLRFDDRKAIDFAVTSLPKVEGLLRVDMIDYLKRKSGQDHGRDVEAWAKWWAENKDDESLDTKSVAFADDGGLKSPRNDAPGGEDDGDAAKGERSSTYYDIKIYAKRIVFVIDTSSSMVRTGNRLDAAKKELALTIRNLVDDTYFTIIAYNANNRTFSRRLVKATGANRAAAVKWVSYLQWARGTNSHGALKAAFLVDPNTETIFFLSDGKPSRGEIVEPEAILAAIKKENAFRKMVINTIGIFTGEQPDEKLVAFMKDLAKQNTGVYKEVK